MVQVINLVIRVFEAFAGIGAQHQALKELGLDYEIVGISEIDKRFSGQDSGYDRN